MRHPPPHRHLPATDEDHSNFGAALAPWMSSAAQDDAARRAGGRILDQWGDALVAQDAGEVERLVARSRAATSARWRLADDEPLLG